MMKTVTCNNESIDGDTVVLVLFVGVRGLESEAGEHGAEKVGQHADHTQGRASL